MKVLFVINNLFTKGNGLSASVRRTVCALKNRGLDVRVLSAGQSDDGEVPDYHLQDGSIPLFSVLIDKQGYKFAKADRKIIDQAVRWADIIHLTEPFTLQIAVCRSAERHGKTCVATYHLHPENLFASVGLEKSKWFNGITMLVWRNTVFNHCRMIQCPTENVRERLQRWHFKADLRVISNGVTQESCQPLNRKHSLSGRIHIISVGRFSREKDQDTLLNAMRFSKYADIIQLHFAGRGPTEQHLKKKAAKLYRQGILVHKPSFGFYDQEGLLQLFSIADLYIHCATIEVEGMSCMEAVCTGIVPIIAKGPLTAASQFAQSRKSIFKAGNPRDLADKIDYWIEHAMERKKEADKYLSIKEQYLFKDTVNQTIKLYMDACKSC